MSVEFLTHEEISDRRKALIGKCRTDALLAKDEEGRVKALAPFTDLKAARYALFRVQNEANGGAVAENKHRRIARKYHKIKGHDGIKNFAITWDIDPNDTSKIVRRNKSVWQAHNEYMVKVAKPLPIKSAKG